MEIFLDQIIVEAGRQRQDLGDLEGLKKSLLNLGLLNPLVVEPAGSESPDKFKLIAGERRYTAIKELQAEQLWTGPVSVTLFQELDQKTRYLLELDENIKRKDLDWKEYCQALDKMFSLCQPSTIEAFAQEIGINRNSVGKALAVASMLDDPLVQQAKNLSNAWTVVSRINSRKMDSMILDINELLEEEEENENVELVEGSMAGSADGSDVCTAGLETQRESAPANLLGVSAAECSPRGISGSSSSGTGLGDSEIGRDVGIVQEVVKSKLATAPALPQYQIQQGDFFEFASSYKGIPFNLVHCDFPYGIEHSRSEQGSTATYGTYEDTADLYMSLIQTLLKYKDQLIAPSAHVVVWLSLRYEEWTKQEFAKHGFTWNMQPFIWFKKDNKGIIADKDCGLRNVGEYALVFNRGRRKVCKNISNIFPWQTTKKFHASEKPGPMLDYLFSGLADETSRVLDPTCGSGTAIHAAMHANAELALGLELDQGFAEKAKEWLELEKKTKGIQKGLPEVEINLEELEI